MKYLIPLFITLIINSMNTYGSSLERGVEMMTNPMVRHQISSTLEDPLEPGKLTSRTTRWLINFMREKNISKIQKSYLRRGAEWIFLGFIPGWGGMAPEFRIWGFVVYPSVFEIYNESGKPLTFNFSCMSTSQAIFAGTNYWIHGIPFLWILNWKIMHEYLTHTDTVKLLSNRFRILSRTIRQCGRVDASDDEEPWLTFSSIKSFKPESRTNTWVHTGLDILNMGFSTLMVAPQISILFQTLKTPTDYMRILAGSPAWLFLNAKVLYESNKSTSDRLANKLLYRSSVTRERQQVSAVLKSAFRALQHGTESGKDLFVDHKTVNDLYKSFYSFIKKTTVFGPISAQEDFNARVALQKLIYIGCEYECFSRYNSLSTPSTDLERHEQNFWKDTITKVRLHMTMEFLGYAYASLRNSEEAETKIDTTRLPKVIFMLQPHSLSQTEDEEDKRSIDSLINSEELSDRLLGIAKITEGAFTNISELRRAWFTSWRFLQNSETLLTGSARRYRRYQAPSASSHRRSNYEKSLRLLTFAHPKEPLRKAAKRSMISGPAGAVLGFYGTKSFSFYATHNIATTFGSTPEEAFVLAENISNVGSYIGAAAGFFVGERLARPVHHLESNTRALVRGTVKAASAAAATVLYFGYKEAIASGFEAFAGLFGSSAGPLGADGLPFSHNSTAIAINNTLAIHNLNATCPPPEPYTPPQFHRESLQVGSSLTWPLMLANLRLGATVIENQTMKIFDRLTHYHHQRTTGTYDGNAYRHLGELGWLAFNLTEGDFWALSFLAGVAQPSTQPYVENSMYWTTAVSGLLARGAYNATVSQAYILSIANLLYKTASSVHQRDSACSSFLSRTLCFPCGNRRKGKLGVQLVQRSKLELFLASFIDDIEVRAHDHIIRDMANKISDIGVFI